MAAFSAGMTREQAAELLAAHNKDPFHIEHGETVEQTMRYFAREYDPENEEFWGIVGLLHDLDWEEHDDEPEKHTLYAAPLIEEAGGTPELIRAIQSHTSDYNTDLPKPELQMEKILFATEELTGLIGAAIVMRPSKSVMDFNVKSLKKKYKDRRFAAGVSREVIASGAEMLGWELDELFARSDVISLHCPLTDETRHMINAAAIEKMKKGVVIVNTSRGGLIDAEALLEGIKARKIGAACLDVYEEEADIFFEDRSGHILNDELLSRLISMPNVIVTSHQAFLTEEALNNIAETTVGNILSYFENDGICDNELCYRCGNIERCKKERKEKCF